MVDALVSLSLEGREDMPLPKQPFFKIFDPRKGQDFRYRTMKGETLSLLEHEFLVISYYPGRIPQAPLSLDVEEFKNLIETSMVRLGKIGFFALSPLTKEVKTSQQINLNQMDEKDGTAIGYFNLEMLEIRRHMEVRRRLVTYEEWMIGSCNEPFVKPLLEHTTPKKWYRGLFPRGLTWDFESLLSQIENIRCLSLFTETGELDFFCRIYVGIDDLIDPLSERLKEWAQSK
jgi:hypothetical protein